MRNVDFLKLLRETNAKASAGAHPATSKQLDVAEGVHEDRVEDHVQEHARHVQGLDPATALVPDFEPEDGFDQPDESVSNFEMEDEEPGSHSWLEVDVIERGRQKPEPPTIGGLLYPGRRHLVSGEPESMKGWLLLGLMVDEIRAGNTVAYIDFEMGASEMLERLESLGLTEDEIREHFLYYQPSEALTDPTVLAHVDDTFAQRKPTIVALDANAGAFSVHRLDPESGRDVELFHRTVIAPLRRHGAATVALDHLPKSRDNRGRFAIGSERKVGAVDVHLGMDVVHTFGRGKRGLAKVTTHKDRPGYLARPKAADLQLVSNPDTHGITWKLTIAEGDVEPTDFRPTALMERVSRHLEQQVAPLSRTRIVDEVSGNRQYLYVAVTCLVKEGFISERDGAGLISEKPFRDAESA